MPFLFQLFMRQSQKTSNYFSNDFLIDKLIFQKWIKLLQEHASYVFSQVFFPQCLSFIHCFTFATTIFFLLQTSCKSKTTSYSCCNTLPLHSTQIYLHYRPLLHSLSVHTPSLLHNNFLTDWHVCHKEVHLFSHYQNKHCLCSPEIVPSRQHRLQNTPNCTVASMSS